MCDVKPIYFTDMYLKLNSCDKKNNFKVNLKLKVFSVHFENYFKVTIDSDSNTDNPMLRIELLKNYSVRCDFKQVVQ